ncbi:DUF6961 family protein [Novosphingobium sp. JCM 18896]|uniref:DUF6961 family protein n=1 Tax=Novosphingobium sp. JCM 18896 TaxID=2989731 RepID=UPI0022228EA1|nr:hypothetical protein [Novosphingobium sp. JCM 18896]MCW1430223.1 hypothetical protein [Novosphingobium sp. JCM 18896]
MTDEEHLWVCALEVERQHGTSAFLFASMRADALLAEGAFEGARVWRAILERIEMLEQAPSTPVN